MRVHEVVRLFLRRCVFDELVGELVEVLVYLHLRPVADGARLDMDHARVRTELLDPWVVLLAPTREDIDLDTACAEVARKFAHVDAHATGAAAAKLRTRTRPDRDHRAPAGHDAGAARRGSLR